MSSINFKTFLNFSGGLTNYLYVCEVTGDVLFQPHEPKKVLLRIYGDIVDQKQRFYEGVVFTLLSERGIGPKTFGVFNSGRIEEFIPVCFCKDFSSVQMYYLANIYLDFRNFNCLITVYCLKTQPCFVNIH